VYHVFEKQTYVVFTLFEFPEVFETEIYVCMQFHVIANTSVNFQLVL